MRNKNLKVSSIESTKKSTETPHAIFDLFNVKESSDIQVFKVSICRIKIGDKNTKMYRYRHSKDSRMDWHWGFYFYNRIGIFGVRPGDIFAIVEDTKRLYRTERHRAVRFLSAPLKKYRYFEIDDEPKIKTKVPMALSLTYNEMLEKEKENEKEEKETN